MFILAIIVILIAAVFFPDFKAQAEYNSVRAWETSDGKGRMSQKNYDAMKKLNGPVHLFTKIENVEKISMVKYVFDSLKLQFGYY